MTMTSERAILAGGCFWGMQHFLRRLPGVISTRVGYSGGEVPNATYRNHGTHAEAVESVFDPRKLSYRKLLEFFFQIQWEAEPEHQDYLERQPNGYNCHFIRPNWRLRAEDTRQAG